MPVLETSPAEAPRNGGDPQQTDGNDKGGCPGRGEARAGGNRIRTWGEQRTGQIENYPPSLFLHLSSSLLQLFSLRFRRTGSSYLVVKGVILKIFHDKLQVSMKVQS